MKILIVDDNSENLEMLMILLKGDKHEVHLATNGQEALDLLQKGGFELIISDILMPVMDGFQLCRKCKKDSQLAKIPFVFYTATYIDRRDEDFAMSLGACKFLRKPMEPEVMLNTIRAISKSMTVSEAKPEEPGLSDESEVFRLYSERLVSKLEKKSLDLKKEIDEHRITEKKLRKSEERFMLAVEGTADGLWDWDMITESAYFSDRHYEMLGFQPGEFACTAEKWKALVHKDDLPALENDVNAYLTGQVQRFESVFRMKTKDGLYRWMNARGKALFNTQGRPYRFVGFTSDITQKKEQEHELIRAKEKAEESDKLKTAFLTNISHEIRTPMNGMLGFIELLKKTQMDRHTQDQYISIIEKSSNRLLTILTDIVEISRIEANQLTVRKNSVDIGALVYEVYASFARNLEAEGSSRLSFSVGVSPDGYHCITDGNMVREVLSRLVSNALKFTAKGSVEIGYGMNGSEELEFYVKDTGLGVPEASFDLIFENFRQADNIKGLELGGTGLGLSIARAYVNALDGKIWLQSAVGKGSVFYFTIPFVTAPHGYN